jgi:predicted glutamine amidotransferase
MCGLAGVASTERMKDYIKRRDAMVDMMFMNTLRGDHSTGLGAVFIDKENEEPLVWKRAMAAPDFLGLDRTKAILRDMEKYSIFLTHNRAATTAAINSNNAHPFTYGHITLTHNGHINNAYELVEYSKRTSTGVDSAQVAQGMELLGEKETLERVTGAYAFAWHNTKDGTLNFARNADRPLRFCYIKGENTLWWGSEREMLVAALRRNKIEIESAFLSVPEKTWLKFNVKDLREYESIPFVPSSRAATGTGAEAATWRRHPNNSSSTATIPIGNLPGSSGENKPNRERDIRVATAQERLILSLITTMKKPTNKEISDRETVIGKFSSRPTGGKKVSLAKERLATTGFGFEQMVVMEIKDWEAYKNQRNRLGKINGTIFNTHIPVIMPQMTASQYQDYFRMPVLLGRVVNYRDKDDPDDPRTLVIEPHPLAAEFAIAWKTRWDAVDAQTAVRNALTNQPNAARGEVPRPTIPKPTLSLPNPDKAANEERASGTGDGGAGDSIRPSFSHAGPRGRGISPTRYAELTKDGCCFCQGDLGQTVADSTRLFWIDDAPACWTCQNDPKNQTEHNIPAPQKGMMH